jgi:transglutaminase-like putative cysteine protease
MHFAIRFLTRYRYAGPVTDNLNALRVTPATTATQRVDDFGVRVEPQTRLHQHLDYFGTTVIEFGISKPHERLAIDVRARVATQPPPEPVAGGWGGVEEPGYRGGAAAEFLLPDALEPDDLRIDELVGEVRGDTPLATLERCVQLVPDRFEYRTGVTYVGSTVLDLLEAGAGVCQDFAHLGLVLLRRNGIAARYVSGYLFAPPDDEQAADSGEVETHAWLEALLPSGNGGEPTWVGLDPTNRVLAGERHVKIGHGRSYRDIPPVKGVYRGAATTELEASVRMHRTDVPARRAAG